MALAPGTRVGPYEIAVQIGAGGMGEVYRARDTKLNRDVAVKVLPERMAADSDRIARLEHEAKTLAALNHPHIAHIYALEEFAGVRALVMELLEGPTLAHRIAQGPIPMAEALSIAIPIAEALDCSHRHDIIHRDLKPTNIMLTATGAKLLDFGLAKALTRGDGATREALTADGVILGTLRYMAPEQLEGRDADARSDLYAFGAVLYEMLSGTPASTSAQVLSDAALDRLVRMCLAKNPNERWQDVSEVLNELRNIAAGRATGNAQPGTARPSIAVMPFLNLSGDASHEYFVDGIVEDIITGLSRIKWLPVIARNSTFVYKGQRIDVRDVGRTLGARYVLEGSLRTAGTRIRVTTQLVDAASGAHVWAERYDRTMADLFDLQDEVTTTIVGVIEPALRQAELDRVKRKRPENMDAYDLYLRAMARLRDFMPGAADAALDLLREALALQPDYPAAQAAAAWCYEVRYMRGGLRTSDKTAALAHARAAIETGADDVITLATAGFVIGLVAHDYETSIEIIQRALMLTNVSSFALALGSIVLAHAGRTSEAIDYAERALRLTPVGPESTNPNIGLAMAYCATGNFEKAAAAAHHAVQSNPRFSLVHVLHAAALSALRRDDEARQAMRCARDIEPDFTVAGFVRAHTGRPEIWNPIGAALARVDLDRTATP